MTVIEGSDTEGRGTGVGIDRRGNLMYAAANYQTVITLAQLLKRAGAVRAMQFDINPEWPTLITYTHRGGLGPTKVVPNVMQPTTRYLVPDDRDFFAVYEAAGEIIERARRGGGPALLECEMVRFFGHFEGDAQTYRAPGEQDEIRANRDCLKRFRAAVTEAGVLTDAELDAIDGEALAVIDQAVVEALAAPEPTVDDLLTDVYVSY